MKVTDWQITKMIKEKRYLPSELLTNEENDTLMKKHPTEWENQATAVVELFLTYGPYHNKWKQKLCGVACFIKDHANRSYFIRIFVLPGYVVEFEQELYSNFLYKKSREFLHTFESDQCMAALNFASVDEAHTFYTVVQHVIKMRIERKSTKRPHLISEGSLSDTSSFSKSTPNLAEQTASKSWFQSAIQLNKPAKDKHTIKKEKKKRKRKKSEKIPKAAPRLTKADIGRPEDFKHVQHMGFDATTGFEINVNDKDYESFFQMAGVTEKQLQDRDTRNFIYDFINKNGICDGRKDSPPPLAPSPDIRKITRSPSRCAPKPPIRPAVSPGSPPPTPPRDHEPRVQKDKGHFKPPPPTLPNESSIPSPPPPPPPPPPSFSKQSPPPSDIPKPPPPPPRIEFSAPPPGNDSSEIHSAKQDHEVERRRAVTDARHGLLSEIRDGVTLKKPDTEVEKQRAVTDARQDFLSEIRDGVTLKKVEEPTASAKSQPTMNDMAGALAKALEERSKVIHSSSDSSDSDSDFSNDDDDWDD